MLTFQTSNVVVGGTVEALRFASEKDFHVVYCKPEPPHFLDRTQEDRLEWLSYCFDLSLRGLLIAPETSSIRLLQDSLRLVGRNFFINVPFTRAFIFSDNDLVGLPDPIGITDDRYRVLDWIVMGDGMSHPHEKIETDSDFVKSIIFYPTERLDGHHPDKKDAVAISIMREENLLDISWSDSYARLKAIKLMREAGISFSDKKIETSHREVARLGKLIYPEVTNVEFML